jgi:hypothetical protein
MSKKDSITLDNLQNFKSHNTRNQVKITQFKAQVILFQKQISSGNHWSLQEVSLGKASPPF